MDEFNEIISDMISNKKVLEMKKYMQHGVTNCFEHCYNASLLCYKIGKKLGMDYKSLARGAMVHDMFLYDWRGKGLKHAFGHNKRAYENASKEFDLNEIEKDVILKHMWPMTIIPPKYKESYVLICVDKYIALNETVIGFFKKIYRFFKKKS